jgi:hypothetical protein
MKLKELNRELERIDELSLTSIKNKSNKFINKVKETSKNFKTASIREIQETKKIVTLLKKKLLQNIELTPSEIKFIKYQSADIIKAVISVGSFFIPIPGVGPMLLLLDKQMVSKYGFSIFPSDTEKKVFENILKK